jgi:hypothetical protein
MARVMIEPKDAQNVKSLVRVAVENELKILQAGVARTCRKLEELEKIYGMSSKQFYNKFKKGEMGDDFEYIRWAGEYETLQQLEYDYSDLLGTEVCS